MNSLQKEAGTSEKEPKVALHESKGNLDTAFEEHFIVDASASFAFRIEPCGQ